MHCFLRYFTYSLICFSTITPSAYAAVTSELIESICEPVMKYEYKGVYPSMSVAEIEALSTNAPVYTQQNDAGSLMLGKDENVNWETYGSHQANVQTQKLYNLTYEYSFMSDRDWPAKNSLAIYNEIMTKYGTANLMFASKETGHNWKIIYGSKQKSVLAPDSPWWPFQTACLAESDGSALLSKHTSTLMNMYANKFDDAYNEVTTICPNAINAQYIDYLRDRYQPKIQFQMANSFTMSGTCPAAEKWIKLESYRKNN